MESLDSFFDAVKDMATHCFVKFGEHRPMFYMQMADSEALTLLDGHWDTLDEKNHHLITMRVGIDLGIIKQACFVTEVWYAEHKGPENGVIDTNDIIPPSERADRKEMLFLVAADADSHRVAYCEIKRPDKKKKPTLGEFGLEKENMEALSGGFRAFTKSDGTRQ